MKPRKPNPFVESQRNLDEARDAFIRAAAAITPGNRQNRTAVASALVEGAYALLKLAEADTAESGLKEATDWLRGLHGEKA